MQLGRPSIEQHCKRVVDFRIVDQVVVLQNQEQVLRQRREVVNEARQHIAQHIGTGTVKAAQGSCPNLVAGLISRKQQVAPEPLRVVVAGVQRHPTGSDVVIAQPFRHNCGLAPAGRGDDKGQRHTQPGTQSAVQPFA